jgi:hypothetical protein
MPAALIPATGYIVPPQAAPPDRAVAANFERFDGLAPLDHPAGQPPVEGSPSSPGGYVTPDVYTPSPLYGLTNTLGGQPLPVETPIFRPPGEATYVNGLMYMQQRLGSGQNYQGIAQTVALGEITTNPPQPGDLQAILGGYG